MIFVSQLLFLLDHGVPSSEFLYVCNNTLFSCQHNQCLFLLCGLTFFLLKSMLLLGCDKLTLLNKTLYSKVEIFYCILPKVVCKVEYFVLCSRVMFKLFNLLLLGPDIFYSISAEILCSMARITFISAKKVCSLVWTTFISAEILCSVVRTTVISVKILCSLVRTTFILSKLLCPWSG
jgi:hypothetical protein